MQLVRSEQVRKYLENDWVLDLLKRTEKEFDGEVVTQKWLKDSDPKRMIFSQMYEDILKSKSRKKILDIGGGYTSLTREMLEKNDYHLVEIFAQESPETQKKILNFIPSSQIFRQDWHSLGNETYDIIVANDLFPNCDQRLDVFLQKFLPLCTTLRLSLTFYEQPRFYQTRRTDADEIFWYVPWSSTQLKPVLEKYKNSIQSYNPAWSENLPASSYNNQRQVLVVELKGDIKQ